MLPLLPAGLWARRSVPGHFIHVILGRDPSGVWALVPRSARDLQAPLPGPRLTHHEVKLRAQFDPAQGPRAGGELLLRRKWLAPHLSAGAHLCWVATLVLAKRGEYQRTFDEPRFSTSWVIGGSRNVWPKPWRPR